MVMPQIWLEGKMIQFQQIIYFLKIAELRSINKAAAKLYVSQPSLSQSIKNLEDELNIRLFRRSNKGVVLTEERQAFSPICREDCRSDGVD